MFYISVLAILVLLGHHHYAHRPVIMFNGEFLTMDGNDTVANSLGIHKGVIQAVGSFEQVKAEMLAYTNDANGLSVRLGIRRHDLKGKTALPGFLDAHGHFAAQGLSSLGIDVASPPFGVISTIDELLEVVAQQASEQSTSRWIIAFNYDDAGLQEQRHPTRLELDKAAPEHAVYLRHRSGHMGVANSKALLALDYRGAAPSSGLLQEQHAASVDRLLQEVPFWQQPRSLWNARNDYLRAGMTTVQDGYAGKSMYRLLRLVARTALLPQRVLVWPAHDKLSNKGAVQAIDWPVGDRRRAAIGAVKLIADGSPQGRTASLSQPYLADDVLGEDFRGLDYLPENELHKLILDYHAAGMQLAIHGNGDAAIQHIINGISRAQSISPRADARHIIVHAQTIGRSQLESLASMDVSVSFFPTHTFYWGDWYRSVVLGEERASKISPLASADMLGVRYSIHADAPVTPIDPMQMLWSASERLTASGFLLGATERVSRLRALRAMTIDVAWQNHLEHDRGSLEVGKLADVVVLSGNPLISENVRAIKVEQVWIGGGQYLP